MRRHLFLLATVVALLAVRPCAAQKFQTKTLQFKGAPEYSTQELQAAIGLKPGGILTVAEISEHAKLLMNTGVFSNLTYRFDGQDVIYILTPSTELYPVRLDNLPLTPGKELDANLHERFPLYHGKVPAEGGLMEDVRGALEKMLAAQGIKATVTAMPFTDPKLHAVTAMSFVITEPPVQMGEIQFASDATAPEAKADPKVREILNKLTGSVYDAEGSRSQIETYLGNYYHDKGYLEAEIHAAALTSAVVTPEAIRVPFQVSVLPGALYKIAGVQLAPGLLVTQADFDKQAHIHPGDIAYGQRMLENWQYISRQYHDNGHLKAAVHPVPSFDRGQQTVSFAVTVEPGPVYTMGTLKIENVSDDLRAAMLAAWKMPAGAVFNEGAIRGFFANTTVGGAKSALERVFETVNASYTLNLNDEAHTADVVLRLEKKH